MRRVLLSATALMALAFAAPANAAFVSTVTSSLPGLTTGCDQSSPTGSIVASCSGGGFSSVAITGAAPPLLNAPDLSATSLTVTSLAANVTLHAVFDASGFLFAGGPVTALLTINNLIGGGAGPFTLSAISPLGSETHTFTAAGSDQIGPVVLGAFTNDQAVFDLTFANAGESVDATIEIIGTPVAEPASLAMLGVGVLGLGLVARRRQSSDSAV